MNKSDKILLIGSGNVAVNLIGALKASGFSEISLHARNKIALDEIIKKFGVKDLPDLSNIDPDTTMVIICTSDDAIELVANKIENKTIPIVHTSGGISMKVLSGKSFKSYGVFYPLQSLSKNNPISLKDVPICIEGNSTYFTDYMKVVGKSISTKVVEINSEDRAYLHLAAVFANNFTNHLFKISEELAHSRGLSFDLLRPLIQRTAEKIMVMNPKEAQTGPAIRNDQKTINNHLGLIKDENIRELYLKLSKNISQSTLKQTHE